jgi:putative ABC transport system ATP-binding protein
MAELIKTVNLEKVYYLSREVAVTALQNINLTVAKGEFVAIMGPSGSGKSTLMQVLGCLDRQTAGDYYLDGVNVSSLNDDELAVIRSQKIGFVFQQFNLLPRMTALENVALPLLYAGAGREISKAKNALAVVDLLSRAEHWPNQLSGGQQQRVAIARALVNNPEIILADEPTGALDTKAGGEIMSLLKALNEKGKTVVLITHEPYIAKQARRIITLRDAQIISDEMKL